MGIYKILKPEFEANFERKEKFPINLKSTEVVDLISKGVGGNRRSTI